MNWINLSTQLPQVGRLVFAIAQDTYKLICQLSTDGNFHEVGSNIDVRNKWKEEEIKWLDESDSCSFSIDTLRKAYHDGQMEAINRGIAIDCGEKYEMKTFDQWFNIVTTVSVGKKLKETDDEQRTSAAFCQCNVSGALPLTENDYLKNKVKELLLFVESDGWVVNGFRTLEIVQELKKLCGNDR